MSRDQIEQPDADPSDPGNDERRLKPMAPGPLLAAGAVGLVAGWVLHRLADGWWDRTPSVGFGQVGVLCFVAAALAWTARATARDLSGERRLQPHQTVNRLLMARACASVGSLLVGGYVGFAIGWINNGAPELLAGRLASAGAAAAACAVILVASLALERACRARHDGRDV